MNTFIVNDAQDHIELFSEKPFKCGMFQMFIKGDMEPSIAEQIPTKKFKFIAQRLQAVIDTTRTIADRFSRRDVWFIYPNGVSLFVDILLGSNREKGVCISLGEDKHF